MTGRPADLLETIVAAARTRNRGIPAKPKLIRLDAEPAALAELKKDASLTERMKTLDQALTWPGKAGDEPHPYRIGTVRHDDRVRASGFLESQGRARSIRHSDIHFQTDQLGDEIGVARRPTFCRPKDYANGLALDIAEIAQSLDKRR